MDPHVKDVIADESTPFAVCVVSAVTGDKLAEVKTRAMETIKSLRIAAQEASGFESLSLSFHSVPLKDSKKVADYGIHSNASLVSIILPSADRSRVLSFEEPTPQTSPPLEGRKEQSAFLLIGAIAAKPEVLLSGPKTARGDADEAYGVLLDRKEVEPGQPSRYQVRLQSGKTVNVKPAHISAADCVFQHPFGIFESSMLKLWMRLLSYADILRSAATCHRWCAPAADSNVWHHMLARDWGHQSRMSNILKFKGRHFYLLYKRKHLLEKKHGRLGLLTAKWVQLQQLESNSAHNGSYGTIINFLKADGKYQVRLFAEDGIGKVIRVRPENVRELPEAPAPVAGRDINLQARFRFVCPLSWYDLRPVEGHIPSKVRKCDACGQNIERYKDLEDYRKCDVTKGSSCAAIGRDLEFEPPEDNDVEFDLGFM